MFSVRAMAKAMTMGMTLAYEFWVWFMDMAWDYGLGVWLRAMGMAMA